MANKKNLYGILAIWLVFTIMLYGCVSTRNTGVPASGNDVNQTETADPVNDRRFDGTWQFKNAMFIFYADTYRILADDETIANGVFIYDKSRIICQVSPGMATSFEYTLDSDTLTLNNPQNPALNGQWIKASLPPDTGNNPLVGTWKGLNGTGKGYQIYQFYSDGTGVAYSCNLELTNMNSVSTITYNQETSTFDQIANGLDFSITYPSSTYEISENTLRIDGRLALKKE
jgi:hypothetical protein